LADISILFDRLYFINTIKIFWKSKPPPKVEIFIMNKNEIWQTILEEEPKDNIDF